jgi:hypothetical protein
MLPHLSTSGSVASLSRKTQTKLQQMIFFTALDATLMTLTALGDVSTDFR